jgi:prepilin-type N-terminal cleavage/methylation domain-containing protein
VLVSGQRAATLCGMNLRPARRAFTLIEILVALILMGVAAAGLVSALTGDRRLRDLAAAQLFAAERARERIESLAALPCSASAGGTSNSAWGSERWNATASKEGQSSWQLADTLSLGRSTAPVILLARVACPE